jgi:hypothetical protein
VKIQLHAFLTSALDRVQWLASRSNRFNPRERAPGAHYTGGWVSPEADLEAMRNRKISVPAGNRTPIPQSCSPKPSQLLGSLDFINT